MLRGSVRTLQASQKTLFRNKFLLNFRGLAVQTVNLDSLGDSITTATLLEWKMKPGDNIKADDTIVVVETDKVIMDIHAKASGTFVEGLHKEGAEVTIGDPLYKFDDVVSASSAASTPKTETASTPAAPQTPAAAKPAAPGKPVVVNVPKMGESITEGQLNSWLVKVGDSVKVDGVVALIDTDKVAVDVKSPVSGKIVEFKAKEGDTVSIDQPLFVVEEGAVDSTPAAAPIQEKAKEAPKAKEASKPAADAPKAASKGADVPAIGAKTGGVSRTETRVKMTKMRQVISNRLKEAQNTLAMLTTFQEVDMSNYIDLRNKYKDEFEKAHNIKLGFMSPFVKAATAALQESPIINAYIDLNTKEIIYRNYIDISVAVASPNGLVVPVLRNTENMSFADVEKQIALYGKKAKENTLALEDMQGGTFTISNGGVFGSLFGTPIINLPQSAILGMHATKQRAVVVNGKVEARPMMYLALTYDHRLIDGREAVTFLKSIANKMEDPARLLLQL